MHTVELPVHYFDASGILQNTPVCAMDQVEAAVQEWDISQNEQYYFEVMNLLELGSTPTQQDLNPNSLKNRALDAGSRMLRRKWEELILERLEECILGTEGLEFVKYLTTEPYIQNPSIHTATSAVFHMSSEKFAQWESGGLELTKLTSADIEQIRTCYRTN